MVRAIAMVGVFVAAACNSVFGIDERTPRAGDGGANTTQGVGTTVGGACSGLCYDALPSDWEGPILLAMTESDEAAPPCPDGAPPSLSLVADVSAPPANCSCSCDSPLDATCSVVLDSYDLDDCQDFIDQRVLTLGACEDTGAAVESGVYNTAITNLGSCTPATVADVPPSVAGRSAVGCEPPDSESCQGFSCVAPDPDFEACIHRPGDAPCPDGIFKVRWLFYDGSLDDRGCSPCTCGPVDSLSCNETVVAYATHTCSGTADNMAAGACLSVSYESVMVTAIAPTGSCTPSGGVAQGSFGTAGPTTVCCAE